MSERFKVTKHEDANKTFKNYGATSAESDVELKGKLLPVSAGPLKEEDAKSHRIVGGSVTTIQTYPEMAALLLSSSGVNHRHACGGTILNNRAILSAVTCFSGPGQTHTPNRWRARLGSSYANSGGSVFNTARFISHPLYSFVNLDNNIGILHVSSAISFTNNIHPGRIAGANYDLGDNQVVWALGWGFISEDGPSSEQLRHVQIWTINQQTCRNQYAAIGLSITDNMLCSGWLNVGGRGQCNFDSGGPVFHNRVVVGISSFGEGCGHPNFASVNNRVSPYTAWINDNR